MIIRDPGHVYALEQNDGSLQELIFLKDHNIHGAGHTGVLCQEVIRALIDRVSYLDGEKHHRNNPDIIDHLRMALTLFETRAIEMKV